MGGSIDIYTWYTELVTRQGRAIYPARQVVHNAIRQSAGEVYACRTARDINTYLDKIEAQVTGRDCRADWRTQTEA